MNRKIVFYSMLKKEYGSRQKQSQVYQDMQHANLTLDN